MPYSIRQKLYRGIGYAVWHDGTQTKRTSLRTKDNDEATRHLVDFKRDMAAPKGALVGDIVEAYIAAKDGRIAGRKKAVVLKEINVIRQALNWRGVKGTRFEAPAPPPPRDRYLTKSEYQKLLEIS